MIHVANSGSGPYHGWHRTATDQCPPHESGICEDGTRYVLGRQTGLDTWAIDLKLRLDSGETRSINLAKSKPADWKTGYLPSPSDYGVPVLAGTPMRWAGAQQEGAAWVVEFRCRWGRLMHGILWVTYYPDQPGWASGELEVTASNPDVPDVLELLHRDIDLRWGDALINVAGSLDPLRRAGDTIADGQCIQSPVGIVWPGRLEKLSDSVGVWSSAQATLVGSIASNGIANLYPGGYPRWRNVRPIDWAREHMTGAIARLRNWTAGPLGVLADSSATGNQEDQTFPGGEMGHGVLSLGCERVNYLVALGQGRRPCHHLEASGDLIDIDRHPNLVVWTGRPHVPSVSRDQLGKERPINTTDAHAWKGPDRQHWLISRLSTAARLTGSHALQRQLGAQARLFLFQERTDKHLRAQSVANFDSARSVGWAGMVAGHLWHNLEDRRVAERVRQRWEDRCREIYLPHLQRALGDVWDPRTNDNRLGGGVGTWWMPWQQAVGAWGLWAAAELIHDAGVAKACRELAINGAVRVAKDAMFRKPDGAWEAYYGIRIDREGIEVGKSSWMDFGIPLAFATLHEASRAGWHVDDVNMEPWNVMLRTGSGKWLPPEVLT